MIPQFEPYNLGKYSNAVKAQIDSGWVGSGKTTKIFEEKFADYVGAKYGIATTSGTAALLVAISAGVIADTTEIALSDYSFIAATNAVRYLHHRPKLYDIDRKTLSLSIDKFIEKPTHCIIYINHNGYVGEDLVKLKEFCNNKSILFIEDAACALGQRYNGKHAGTFGDIGCFSFSVPKLLTTGQGGMIVTNDTYWNKRCRELIDHGSLTWREDGFHRNIGVNFKLNDMAAALGLAQLERIDELLELRKEIYNRYITNGITLHSFGTASTWMNILVDSDAFNLMQKLKENNIQSKMYYRPIHKAIGLVNRCKEFSSTIYAYHHSLYLPSSLTLTNNQIDRICEIIQ